MSITTVPHAVVPQITGSTLPEVSCSSSRFLLRVMPQSTDASWGPQLCDRSTVYLALSLTHLPLSSSSSRPLVQSTKPILTANGLGRNFFRRRSSGLKLTQKPVTYPPLKPPSCLNAADGFGMHHGFRLPMVSVTSSPRAYSIAFSA